MTTFPVTRRTTSQVFQLSGERYFLANAEQSKQLNVKRAWDSASDSRQQAAQIGQLFEVPLADFHEGYGFTFSPNGTPVYEQADGWDASAPGKVSTWPRLATCESVTDTDYRGWLYFDYASGYLYMFRGKYATKYHPDDTVNGTWSILEFHEFGAGMVVAGKPAVYGGSVYVPVVQASTGTLQVFQALTAIATPVTSVQTVTIAGTPTGGTYTITYNDGVSSATTANIAYNASGADVQAALRLLPGLQKVTVVTTGTTPNFTHTITLTAAQTVQGTAVPYALTVTDNTTGGTHSVTPGVSTAGSGDTWKNGPASHEASYFTVWNKPTVGAVLVEARGDEHIAVNASDPLTAGDWGADQAVDDATYKVTALATLGRFLMVGKENGIFSFDESGTAVNEIPALNGVPDSQNCIGMVQANGWLYIPHKLGTIRWRMGSPWAILGAEEDQRLEGDITAAGWGRVVGIAPYGKYTYVTVNDYLDAVSSVVSWQPPTQNRQPILPHMHHRTTSALEDAAIAVLKASPVSPHAIATWTDDNAVGTVAWDNPTYAKADNTLAATAASAGTSHYLKGLDGAYAIPTTATITGIQLDVIKQLQQQSYNTGATSPGTGANFSGFGTNAWTNPGNITSSDDAYATNATAGNTQGLRASNFGFSLASTATVLGIKAEVERHGSSASTDTNTGASIVGSGANVGSTNAWSNPSNITAQDGSAATVSVDGVDATDYLVGTTLGFAVPTNATITGIKAEAYCRSATGLYTEDAHVYLTKDGSTTVGSDAAITSLWDAAYSWRGWGGSTSLWGTTWTPAEVNASSFGVMIAAKDYLPIADTAYVDAVRITVYYRQGLFDYRVSIIKADGSAGSTNKAATAGWPTADAYATYGGASDLWGETWTYADINDTDFGVAIAATVSSTFTASVDHVRVTVYYQDGDVVDSVVKLVKAGSVVGDNKADTTTQWPATAQTVTYGGSTSLWGTTWTAAQINASDFGFVLSALNTSGTGAVFYATLTVSYTLQGINDPSSYLAVITVDPNTDGATATPYIYKLPRAGLTAANDPNIDKSVSSGCDFRTARLYGPSRTIVKQWLSYECHLTITPSAGAPTLAPGVQIQAQVDDDGTWFPLSDIDGQTAFSMSGDVEVFFPRALSRGKWVQLRLYMAAATSTQAGAAVVMRDGILRGNLIPKITDQITAVVVLREGGTFEDGYTERRSVQQQLDDLQGLQAPDDTDLSPEPVEYVDPTDGSSGWVVVQTVQTQEFRFIPGRASQWVATVKGRRVQYAR